MEAEPEKAAIPETVDRAEASAFLRAKARQLNRRPVPDPVGLRTKKAVARSGGMNREIESASGFQAKLAPANANSFL